jgi:hypothetical protein
MGRETLAPMLGSHRTFIGSSGVTHFVDVLAELSPS